MQTFSYQGFQCAYDVYSAGETTQPQPPLLLIHPIGVGLSGQFWTPFAQRWQAQSHGHTLYIPDLLGCGQSDMPRMAITPQCWAKQMAELLQQVIHTPTIVVVQGASLPVALELMKIPEAAALVHKLVLSGPPTLYLLSQPIPPWQQQLNWRLFASPLGWAFFQYARTRSFLKSFSIRQLFARAEDVNEAWLSMLEIGAKDVASRHAVFSFLAGFWRQDYTDIFAQIHIPTLIVMGENASTIDRKAKQTMQTSQTGEDKLQGYLKLFSSAQGVMVPGRNVVPYESTEAFMQAVESFLHT
jgi:pimeloyl-ACP methyl ester carboxylesterase